MYGQVLLPPADDAFLAKLLENTICMDRRHAYRVRKLVLGQWQVELAVSYEMSATQTLVKLT